MNYKMIDDYSEFEVKLGMLYAGKKSGVNCKPDGLPCDYEQSNIKDQHRKREGGRGREGEAANFRRHYTANVAQMR